MSEFLNLSDEEFMNTLEPDLPTEETGSEEEHAEQEVEMEDAGSMDEQSEEESEEEGEQEEEAVETDEDPEPESEEETDEEGEATEEEVVAGSLEDLQRILAPFKANGTEIQVKSPEEALQLMKMGANYTKKMQALQPNLKVLKTLEKAQLLDADKINHLIDLSKKDPKAIAQLMKEAELDPMDLEQDVEYTPTDHQVSDSALQLDSVLEEIESTPTYGKCMDVVGNQWDASSQELLAQKPQLIADINEQMRIGVFDKIQQEVQRMKVFGGLSGMSDFEAYQGVGRQMAESGALNEFMQKPQPVATSQPKPKDTARSQRRKAASTPKVTRKQTKKEEFNPLAMSDEEFLKLNDIHI